MPPRQDSDEGTRIYHFPPHPIVRLRTAPDGNNHTHTHLGGIMHHIYRSPWTSSSLVYTTPVPNGGGRPRPLGRYPDHVRRPSVYCRCRLSQTKQQRPALLKAIRCYKPSLLLCLLTPFPMPIPPSPQPGQTDKKMTLNCCWYTSCPGMQHKKNNAVDGVNRIHAPSISSAITSQTQTPRYSSISPSSISRPKIRL